jgi:hypothetical protein
VAPRLRGDDRAQVSFDFGPAPAPVESPRVPIAATPTLTTSLPPPALARPRLVLSAYVPFMFGGHFGADPDALSGVQDVSPGFGGSLGLRFGYRPYAGAGPATFREVGFAYALNRYTVRGADDPAASSDLTFHRATLTFGLGRRFARAEYSVALAVGYGGVYDGKERLSVGGRDYGMVGIGVQGRLAIRMVGGSSHGLAVLGLADLMYYAADASDDDHWYGLAPSLGAGVLVY